MTQQFSLRARQILNAALALAIAVVTVIAWPEDSASAAPGEEFDPGYIISDEVFYDGTSMSASEIQTFLNAKVPTCTSGYVCLKNFKQTTPTMAANEYCDAYVGGSNESAATIIAKVGAACDISPKVILVTLQKEQGLVTHVWPSDWRYEKAMGYACPDTAACDSSYGGFFYQVYYAAKQFQRYAQLPTRYNYQAGRANNILYHPNASCGASSVYIQNKATAGLYNYTPYQPNRAALNNLYGTGDSCSSYGNRNFYRYYWDWFGDPTVSSPLIKASNSDRIYLVTPSGSRFWIDNWTVYTELRAKLGDYATVSPDYVDSFADAGTFGRLLTNAAGRISLLDDGELHPFPSCAAMKNFGYATCGGSFVTLLSDADYNSFTMAEPIYDVVDSDTGSLYSITSGTFVEYIRSADRTAAGFSNGTVELNDDRLAALTALPPYVPVTAIVTDTSNGQGYLIVSGVAYPVDDANIVPGGIASGYLSHASVELLTVSDTHISSLMTDGDGTALWLTNVGAVADTTARLSDAGSLTTLPAELASIWPVITTVEEGDLVKERSSNPLYYVSPTGFRHIRSWQLATLLAGSSSPTYTYVPQGFIDAHTDEGDMLMPGALYRTVNDRSIYYISGPNSRHYVSSFDLTSAAGVIKSWSTLEDDAMDAYTTGENFGYGYVCNGTPYIASGGTVHKVPADLVDDYTVPLLALDSIGCTTVKVGADATPFIAAPDGRIFQVENGTKRHVTSWAVWVRIRGSYAALPVTSQFAAVLPDGDPVT